MKKIITLLLCLLFVLMTAFPAFAAKEDGISFFIGIYDDVGRRYAAENQTFTVDEPLTVLGALSLLAEEGVLDDFTVESDRLTSISWTEEKETHTLKEGDSGLFYVKRNGAVLSSDQMNSRISDGDILEWIYSTRTAYEQATASSEEEPEHVSLPAELWNETAAEALNQACDWLNTNKADSSFYLVAMGCAGKNADVGLTNDLLAEVSRHNEYANPTEYARRVLMLSSCGYDGSDTNVSSLLASLMGYENIMKKGIFGAVNTLLAYDCRNYSVPNGVINSRASLVEHILVLQKSDGSFPILPGGASDIDTTAMTVTALSRYLSEARVKTAVDRAVEWLAGQQTETGGFGYEGQENCESLAQVIIALSSAGIPLTDERFVKGDNITLADSLLAYRNADGGFGHTLGAESSTMPTEQAIIALCSIKKGGYPYRVTTSAKNTVAVSQQTPLKEVKSETTPYFYAAASLVALFILAVLAVVCLKHTRKSKKGNK